MEVGAAGAELSALCISPNVDEDTALGHRGCWGCSLGKVRRKQEIGKRRQPGLLHRAEEALAGLGKGTKQKACERAVPHGERQQNQKSPASKCGRTCNLPNSQVAAPLPPPWGFTI